MAKAILLYNLLLLLAVSQLRAQALKIGDTIPDTEIHNIFNYSSNTIRLSDFRKKYILLDFWSTNCTGCIQSFRRIDSLQKQFSKNLQVILINLSSPDSTRRFFASHKKVFKPDIPFITSATLLYKYFPHLGEPFHVLLDTSSKIISLPEHVSFSSMSKIINGQEVALDQEQKTLYLKNALEERLQPFFTYYSCLVHNPKRIQLTGARDDHEDSSFDNITCNYASISWLYAIAYSDTKDGAHDQFLRPGRLIVESESRDRYFKPDDPDKDDIWRKSNSYAYQLIMKKDLHLNKYLLMQEDLSRVFSIQVRIEKRKVKCLTLVRTSTKDKVTSKGGQIIDTYYLPHVKATHIDSIRMYINGDYRTFSDRLLDIIEYNFKRPFVDATGFNPKKLISIEMDGAKMDSFSLDAYREELRRYGLDLVEKEWLMDVLVLREKKGSSL